MPATRALHRAIVQSQGDAVWAREASAGRRGRHRHNSRVHDGTVDSSSVTAHLATRVPRFSHWNEHHALVTQTGPLHVFDVWSPIELLLTVS